MNITIQEYLKGASKPVIKGKFIVLNEHFFLKKKKGAKTNYLRFHPRKLEGE